VRLQVANTVLAISQQVQDRQADRVDEHPKQPGLCLKNGQAIGGNNIQLHEYDYISFPGTVQTKCHKNRMTDGLNPRHGGFVLVFLIFLCMI